MKREIISKKKIGSYWDCVVKYKDGTQMRALLDDAEIKLYEIEKYLTTKSSININKVMRMIEDYGVEKYRDAI